MIYFDNAATTFPKPETVYQALDYAQRNLSFNAGRGAYEKSSQGIKILDELRQKISNFCCANAEDVTLLSSATESLNLIINGLNIKEGSVIYISPFEHNAIIRPLFNLQKRINFEIKILPFDKKTWLPNLTQIRNMFALEKPSAVFLSQISNVTGLILDYNRIFEISKEYNAINILDAAQGFGVVKIEKANVDFIVFAGHKSLYGPFGIAGFINLSNNELEVVKSGGNGSDTLNHEMPKEHHNRYESGSQNVPAAYGLLKSIEWLSSVDVFEHEKKLTQYLIKNLQKCKKINLYIPDNVEKIFGIVSFSVDGYQADEVGQILNDEFGIMIRTGYHCSPFVHEFINSTNSNGTDRISISYFSSQEEIDTLVKALNSL